MKLLIAFVLLFGIQQTVESYQGKKLSPIILVPGIGNNILDARIDKVGLTAVNESCRLNGENRFEFWANPLYFLYYPRCFVEIFRLFFNTTTKTTKNNLGVDIETTDFGNTTSVEYFSSTKAAFAKYFADLVEHLVVKFGYERGVSIHGAPYDFRKAPNEQETFFANLKNLTENTYSNNGESKVILLGHSLGCLYILEFLNRQDQLWKNKYVRSFISTSGPYGGSLKPLRVFASGDNLGNNMVNGAALMEGIRTMTSNAFLLPDDAYWNGDEVLVCGPKRNYTVKQYRQFFKDIGFPIGYEMRKAVEPFIKNLKPPNVKMYCVYGPNVNTTEQLVYKNWTTPDREIQGDGDGTVNMRSLLGCREYKKANLGGFKEHQVTSTVPFNHAGIISNKDYIDFIDSIVQPE